MRSAPTSTSDSSNWPAPSSATASSHRRSEASRYSVDETVPGALQVSASGQARIHRDGSSVARGVLSPSTDEATYYRGSRRTGVVVREQEAAVSLEHLLRPGCTLDVRDEELEALWVALVHQAVRQAGGRVLGPVTRPQMAQSYYAIRTLSADGVEIRILLHAMGRLVAAAQCDSSGYVLAFLPAPEGHLFTMAGLRVAAPEELDAPFEADVTSWPKHERNDIKHHKPERIGDVLFNCFD